MQLLLQLVALFVLIIEYSVVGGTTSVASRDCGEGNGNTLHDTIGNSPGTIYGAKRLIEK